MAAPARRLILGLIVVSTLVAAGLVAWVGPMAAPLVPTRAPWLALTAGFVMAELLIVRLHHRSQAHEFNLTEVPLVIGLFMASPIALVTANLVAVGLVRLLRRQAPIKAAFNLTAGAMEVAVAVGVTRLIAAHAETVTVAQWTGALAGPLAATICSALLVTAVIALTEGSVDRSSILSSLTPSVAITLATASLTFAGLVAVAVQPLVGPLLVAPVLVLFLGYRAYIRQIEESGRLAFLTRFTVAMASAGGVEESLHRVLELTSERLGAATAEVILLPNAIPLQGSIRLRLEAGAVGTSRVAGETHQDDEPIARYLSQRPAGEIVRHLAGHPLQVDLADAGFGDAILVPLENEREPLGLLVIGNREGDVAAWGPADLELAVAVAKHTAAILHARVLQGALQVMADERAALERASQRDELTGLANRRGLHEALASAAAAGMPAAALYIDLDDFKQVNDTYGHAAGDALLRAVGMRLRALVRTGDVAARIGGDEFVLLLVPGDDLPPLAELAERIRRVVAEPVSVDGVLITPSASVGSARGTVWGDGSTLLGRADSQMYRAKAARKHAATQRGHGLVVEHSLVDGRDVVSGLDRAGAS